jgi:hypothetical protein
MTLPEAVVSALLAIYPQVCLELQDHFPEQAAKEIAKYALVRRAFEDGWNRPPNVSVPGLGTGKAGRERIELARKNRELSVYTVVGEEDRRFIALYGPEASIVATVAVGLTLGEDPKKANLGYGPGGEMLNRAVEEIWGKD